MSPGCSPFRICQSPMDATYNPICYISFFRRQMSIGFASAYIIIYYTTGITK
jgi:hypothetical protein